MGLEREGERDGESYLGMDRFLKLSIILVLVTTSLLIDLLLACGGKGGVGMGY